MALTAAGFVEVADRVWVGRYEPCAVNVTVVDGEAGRVVVDTRGTAEEGRELARDLARLGARDVVAVLNTHAHFDHTFGNVAFPGVAIWGHRRVAELLGDDEAMASPDRTARDLVPGPRRAAHHTTGAADPDLRARGHAGPR